MKKALIIIGIIVVVFIIFGVVYYFGYSVTEPETQVAPPDETVTQVTPPDKPAVEVNGLKTLVFTDEEINSLLTQAVALVVEAGLPAKLDYARARLAEDRMFLSVSAEALDMKIVSEDIEVWFQGTEVLASGKVPLGGLNADFSIKARITLNGGKLAVAIEDIKPAAISFMLLYGRGINREELNQYLNQKLAEIPFSFPFQELEEITVEGGKLIIKGR